MFPGQGLCRLDNPSTSSPAARAQAARAKKGHPGAVTELRAKVTENLAEVLEQAMHRAVPSLESQVWNLHGQAVYQELLGQEVRVFARKRFGVHHQLPLLLQSVGINHALLVPFDESVVPAHRSPVVSWPSTTWPGRPTAAVATELTPCADLLPPGPLPAPDHHAGPVGHPRSPASRAPGLDLLPGLVGAVPARSPPGHSSRAGYAVVLRWQRRSLTGDYASPASPDEFHGDYLVERTTPIGEGEEAKRPTPHPISTVHPHCRSSGPRSIPPGPSPPSFERWAARSMRWMGNPGCSTCERKISRFRDAGQILSPPRNCLRPRSAPRTPWQSGLWRAARRIRPAT